MSDHNNMPLFPLPATQNGLHGAVLSPCGTYRYTLERVWEAALPRALFVMLNPSTADASVDDPTIRRCRSFATREGCGGLTVVNLFALRSPDPEALLDHPDPVGPDNSTYIALALDREPAHVIAAWGAHRFATFRARQIATALQTALDERGGRVECLGLTKGGQPRHPLYIRGDAPLIPFTTDGGAA